MASLRVIRVYSSLPLQRLLFFNSYLSVPYGAAQIAQLLFKLQWLGVSAPARIYIAVLVPAWCLIEMLRLWLGFAGNLREHVRSEWCLCRHEASAVPRRAACLIASLACKPPPVRSPARRITPPSLPRRRCPS